MAEYKIECEQFLGFSHSGSVTTRGESIIELSDEEAATLVRLIREKGTTDIDELNLKTSHPELYEKLDEAYYDMARHAEYMHWLWDGYDNGYNEYDAKELMDYCERECGFNFEFIEEDYLDKNGEIDEESIGYDKTAAFHDWLDGYLRSLSDDDAAEFMLDHMDADVDIDNIDDVEYSVNIPEEIIQKAQEQA